MSPAVAAGRAACVAVAVFAVPAWSASPAMRTVCGVRDGTAGNAFLISAAGVLVIELARQGGSQALLEQADRAVGRQPRGETGTQNGARYCLRVRRDQAGRPIEVLGGWRAARRR